MILTHPALRLLARRKFRGFWRKQLRRFKTPSGAIFALVGLGVFALWLGGAMLGQVRGLRPGFEHREAFDATRMVAAELFLLAGVILTIIGSFSHRGLYLPKEEIELLLAAPVTRADLVRYRMLANLGRSLFGGLFIGILCAGRAAVPVFGFAAGMLYTLTLPAVGQAVSLLAGDAENRFAARFAKVPGGVIGVVVGILVAVMISFLFSGISVGDAFGNSGVAEAWTALASHPVVRALGAPLWPWASLLAAETAGAFALSALVCVAIWVALFEFTARLPIDFRELSLATSADVAKKLARRRTGGVASSAAARRGAGWTIPWLFGRGAFGALAWRKTGSILRKARGSVITGLFIIVMVTWMASNMVRDRGEQGAITTSAFIAVFGMLYLTASLRFDFREDLERMDVVKCWPIEPWKIFLATLLPEVLFVTVLIDGAVLARAAAIGAWHASVFAVLLGVPLVALMWVALDNAVFLFAPVRYVPGQEGALQHAGRAVLLMILRMAVLFVIGLGVALPAILLNYAGGRFGLSPLATFYAGFTGGFAVALLETALLIWIGGRMLARFDVARDRG